jgi:hypothetical protein
MLPVWRQIPRCNFCRSYRDFRSAMLRGPKRVEWTGGPGPTPFHGLVQSWVPIVPKAHVSQRTNNCIPQQFGWHLNSPASRVVECRRDACIDRCSIYY